MKIYLLIFIISNSLTLAQWDSSYIDESQTLEDLIQESELESVNSAASDVIEDQINNPVDLNTAEIPELLSVPYIDLNTANKILGHRKKFGPFFSANEIYSIKEIAPETAAKILPFLTAKYDSKENKNAQDFFTGAAEDFNLKMRNRISKDLQTREAYKQNKFLGSGFKYYNRFLGDYNGKYQAGILTEKDPGEKSIDEFASFFIFIKNIGILKNIVAGDYNVEAGQGIALWSPYGFSKGSESVFPIKKNSKNIKPYKSSDENKFFRGAAAEIVWDNFSITAFYSKNKLDATIDPSFSAIKFIPVTGFHRTNYELSQRKTAEEILMGMKADCKFKFNSGEDEINLNTGALYYQSKFSNPFLAADVFDLKGSRFSSSSVYYDFYYRTINIFGEFAYNGISTASINGLIISVTKDFSFITSIRSYPRNFYSLHGSALAEGSGRNEIGFYNGVRWKTKLGTINFYYDQFKFPYASYQLPLPAAGNEFLFSLHSKPFRKLETRVRIKHENKENAWTSNFSRIITGKIKKSLRIEMIYNVSKKIRFKERIEINNFILEDLNIDEQGILFFQDIRVMLFNQITFSGRITFFKTDSFNSAVYAYENDIQGMYSNSALYGEGVKWYFLFRFNPVKNIAFSCKYSELYKPREKSLYSGDEEITGNLDNRLSMQLDFNF
ncbi:MAG: ComEA family DNA-binding protein [Ignavibacteria bacterium]